MEAPAFCPGPTAPPGVSPLLRLGAFSARVQPSGFGPPLGLRPRGRVSFFLHFSPSQNPLLQGSVQAQQPLAYNSLCFPSLP